METHWLSYYDKIKKEVQDLRKQKKKCSNAELTQLEDKFNKLEKSLQIIKLSPMEYEV
jgi:hypothetical protein